MTKLKLTDELCKEICKDVTAYQSMQFECVA